MSRLFTECGAKPMCDIGFGDDSEMGGMKPGYERWSAGLFAALAKSGGTAEAASSSKKEVKLNGAKYDPGEYIKMGSGSLKQPLLDDLMDPTNLRNICAASAGLSKHHGIYQQKARAAPHAACPSPSPPLCPCLPACFSLPLSLSPALSLSPSLFSRPSPLSPASPRERPKLRGRASNPRARRLRVCPPPRVCAAARP